MMTKYKIVDFILLVLILLLFILFMQKFYFIEFKQKYFKFIFLRNCCNQSFFTIIMSDSTSIMDLPMDPTGGGNVGNISAIAKEKEKEVPSNNVINQPMTLDQTTINQIVNTLQQASASGVTQLPSRDMPMNPLNISNDPQIQANYVPPPPQNQNDYINNYERTNDMIHDYNAKVSRNDSLDEMYSEIQTPLLISVLYFLFQLPFFRKKLFSYFPVLFSMDGNFNLNGHIFTSILFGLLFYLLNKVSNTFNKF
jgi:hypothetical protein